MNPERWRQIEELYQSALKLEAAERTALLAGVEPELRHEVESVLAQEGVGGRAGNMFLQRIKPDGTGLQKVIPDQAAFLYDTSPDGKWPAAWVGSDVRVYPTEGGLPTLICAHCGTAGEENRGVTPSLVNWSRDTKPWTIKVTQIIAPDTELLDYICLENEKSVQHLPSQIN